MKIIEVNEKNEKKYLNQIADLEKKVLKNMEDNGKTGQLFITGPEDISKYIHSKENTVLVSVDDNDKVDATTYITQGQGLFTYNDITKYFKVSDKYDKYVKSKYANEGEYKKAALDAYKLKIDAYKYARAKILKDHPQFSNIDEYIENEKNSETKFDEKSELREKLNSYMYEFIDNEDKSENKNDLKKYEQFYWMTFSKVKDLVYGDKGKDIKLKSNISKELEKNLDLEKEHERFCEQAKLKIYDEKNNFNQEKYFSANPQNSIEIDTYITDPEKRSFGKARALVYEGIKKHINKFFENPKNEEIFLCSTLHRDNVSSKYVSEFFDLKDSLFVNRRHGRDREVHITRVKREEANKYLEKMAEKLAVLYDYNPENLKISDEQKAEIFKQQSKYELGELHRLNKIRRNEKKVKGAETAKSTMYGNFMKEKLNKIDKLKKSAKSEEQER